jgi:serpin B
MKALVVFASLLAAACAAPAPPDAAASGGPSSPEAPSTAPVAAEAVARGNSDFGVALYKSLADEPGNVFLSPISIAGAFGPVSAGARQETLAEIARALRLPAGGGPGLHPALGGLLRDLEREREGTRLSIANALWVQRGLLLKAPFEAIAREAYDARVESLDFVRGEEAAARINGWVKEETRGRIPTLISPDSLNGDTALVITNAVYFLGDWTTPFNASNTRDEPFYLQGGGVRQIPLMYRKDPFRYLETATFQAVDLPYKDERLSMSLFLPKRRDGLAAFEAELSEAGLRSWLERLDAAQPREVRLHLPKLEIKQEYDLVPPLRSLGINSAFTPNRADLRGIAEADLFISQVIHKTFLRVDEKGTEAAAATGIEIEVTSAPLVPPITFRADHPFFFVIRDKTSGAILFLGRIAAP